jgi:hypothetical protein
MISKSTPRQDLGAVFDDASVSVADNGNSCCASPVHHEGSL